MAYVIGGMDTDYFEKLASMERYDWVVYVLGGYGDEAATVLKFDTREETWSTVAFLPDSIIEPAVCSVGSDMYVFGGFR
jgi:hypothetical protein